VWFLLFDPFGTHRFNGNVSHSAPKYSNDDRESARSFYSHAGSALQQVAAVAAVSAATSDKVSPIGRLDENS
jgi:hypothetical protein